MNGKRYKELLKAPIEELYTIAAKYDTHPDARAARNIIESRRTEPMINAAKKSARWAAIAAIAAFITVLMTLIFSVLNYCDKSESAKQYPMQHHPTPHLLKHR